MANNIEPTLFSDAELAELISSAPDQSGLANYLAGKVNFRIKRLKDALEAEIQRGLNGERNYARALGQIDGLKHAVEVLATKKSNWNERDYYD